MGVDEGISAYCKLNFYSVSCGVCYISMYVILLFYFTSSQEILLCRVNFKNDLTDRRIILYFNDCGCGRSYCQEKAAYLVRNSLERVILKDIAKCFMIE